MTIVIAIVSLVFLLVLHEFGHFILAKKFGVKVEEFGVGYPPRIFGKRIGETVYSLNLLPFGAFVRIKGEMGQDSDWQSFSGKPIWQRALIVAGGVISFWLFAFVIFSFTLGLGTPTAVSDQEQVSGARVQIAALAPDSPAQKAGIRPGDIILQVKSQDLQVKKVDKVAEVQDFAQANKGKEVIMTIQRGKEIFDVSLVPRVSPPEGEGIIGVMLTRTAIKKYSWYQSPIEGAKATYYLTEAVVLGWGGVISNLAQNKPTGVQFVGPVGIFSLLGQAYQVGVVYYLQFIALISIYLALFNILPIPVTDGGKLLFLGIEAVRRKPISLKIEQTVTAFFTVLLLALMVWVTIKDVIRLF